MNRRTLESTARFDPSTQTRELAIDALGRNRSKGYEKAVPILKKVIKDDHEPWNCIHADWAIKHIISGLKEEAIERLETAKDIKENLKELRTYEPGEF